MVTQIKVGDRIHHNTLGQGIVERLVGNDLAEIRFKKGVEYVYLGNVQLLDSLEHEKQKQKEKKRREAEEWERKLIESKQAELKSQIISLLDDTNFEKADHLYKTHCTEWWSQCSYEAEIDRARFIHRFMAIYNTGSLAELDALYLQRQHHINLSADDFITLKLPKVKGYLEAFKMPLDGDQERANARPEKYLLIYARAGSGKTRTLCARAALSIHDEQLMANQVMILAFNKSAAVEVKHRVQRTGGVAEFDNARTFHSLAYQLVKPKKKLLFDAGGDPSAREQSRFAQQMMQRILNPAFKAAMIDFFRKELEEIENIGRDLPPQEYLHFRRSLKQVTLKGQRVKSNGEKFIADYLFEHGIEYTYEKVWDWNTSFLDNIAYKPDFSILANGNDVILEHWAIDPEDPNALLPEHWDITAEEYRQQIFEKRKFWESKEILLLETHSGLLNEGRETFERHLESILKTASINHKKLPKEEIINRVFITDFAISRMSELFLQFIQRAKKRGWSVGEISQKIQTAPSKDSRTQLFYELASRAYREYEVMLEEQGAMDFDDLLIQATEEVEKCGGNNTIHLGRGKQLPLRDLRWILLDEYQDFSELYSKMLNAILKVNPAIRLVAVGDDWQAINSFAGAELRFFKNFTEYFPGAATIGVTTNYRSDKSMVLAGNQIMEGRGSAAKPSRTELGLIEIKYIDDMWVEFRQGSNYEKEREKDSPYLQLSGKKVDNKASEAALRLAKALKICTNIVLNNPSHKTMLIARMGTIYGVTLDKFRSYLIKALSAQPGVNASQIEQIIIATTAHRSKGQEAHNVIILDTTDSQFPKIHPDNLLFKLFGVTIQDVLEEERRLFYVALTRAEHCLYLLTEKGKESPYLKEINHIREVDFKPTVNPLKLGNLASRIQKRLVTPTLNIKITRSDRDAWKIVRANISPHFYPLASALRKAKIPPPETEYFLPKEDNLFAEMAWPQAIPPVAILNQEQIVDVEKWKKNGWRVPSIDLTTTEIVRGLKHYLGIKN